MKYCGFQEWITLVSPHKNVVERMLAQRGVKRDDLGRDEFIKEVWKWKETSGGTILNQLKRLGASCDWSKERFTMDEGLSKAVRIVLLLFIMKISYIDLIIWLTGAPDV